MNPQVQETVSSTLLNLGLPGVCILGLTAAVVFLMRTNVRLQEKLDVEHEKRVTDQQANTRVLLEAHDRLNQGLEIVDKTLDHLKG